MSKNRKEITKEILDVDFEDVGKSKMFDDDGYEEGKSKDREMTANAASTNKKSLNVVKQSGNKAGKFRTVSDLLKKPAKIIQIDGSKKNR
jgi:hypothetical protein|tara:strand:+ start:189 stop:458 length:270 start_codon:yes stop_codon:yes gene_type:complete